MQDIKKVSARDVQLDSLCGVLVVYMILGHIQIVSNVAVPEGVALMAMRALNFFMAWFYFKSGMFAGLMSFKSCLEKSFHRLIVPYIEFSVIGYAVERIMACLRGNYEWGFSLILAPIRQVIYGGAVNGNVPLWFLVSLFAVRLLACLRKYVGNVCLAIIALALYFAARSLGIPVVWAYNIPLGLFFYEFGIIFRDLQYNKTLFILSGLVYVALLIFTTSSIDFRTGQTNGNPILLVLFATSGIFVWDNIFKRLKLTFLHKIGEDSMWYYCVHWIFLIVINTMLDLLGINEPWIKYILLIIFVVPCLAIGRKIARIY